MMRSMEHDMGRAIIIISRLVKDRIQEQKIGSEKSTDFLDVLLEYEEQGRISQDLISQFEHICTACAMLQEMFFAGSETTSSTVEWAMAELLRHLKSMKNVKEIELLEPDNNVEESDTDRLPCC
ncbi:hypothetical protein SADUNF_Sadunf16G0108200 [Salix dunnii]|uniref:Cytochrome P450 n=1 Tax=Salix dunnii TaxID=1413687 RepID=A0A835JAE8_9ROSI|nr:hypothetical protein SADUNF_Sadunf16G0108200 [Salix dunnii]